MKFTINTPAQTDAITRKWFGRIGVLFEHSKLFRITFVITNAAVYGFNLTNIAVGIDDRDYSLFIGADNLLLSQGRWCYLFWRRICDVFEFLPFFEDFFALVMMMFGILIWVHLLKKFSYGRFDEVAAAIFACAMSAFAYIPAHFVFNGAQTQERGPIYIMIPLALLLFWDMAEINDKPPTYAVAGKTYPFGGALAKLKFALPRLSFLKLFLAFLLILFAGNGLKSSCSPLPFLLGGFFIIALSVSRYSPRRDEYTIKKSAGTTAVFAGLVLLVAGTDSAIPFILQSILGVLPSVYLSQFTPDISTAAHNLYQYITGDPTFLIIFVLSVLVMVTGVVTAVRRKTAVPFLAAFGVVFCSVLLIPLIVGERLYERMLSAMCLFFGFAISFVYINLKDFAVVVKEKNVPLKPVLCYACVIIIIMQAKYSNEVYFNDYLRYQYDVHIMNKIVDDISSVSPNDKPVYIINGLNEPQNENYYFYIQQSLFAHRNDTDVPFGFLNFHGYMYGGYKFSDGAKSDAAQKIAETMPCYPTSGYVKALDDFTIVKLGEWTNPGTVDFYEQNRYSKFFQAYRKNSEPANTNS